MNSSFSFKSNHPGAIHPMIMHIIDAAHTATAAAAVAVSAAAHAATVAAEAATAVAVAADDESALQYLQGARIRTRVSATADRSAAKKPHSPLDTVNSASITSQHRRRIKPIGRF